jgi:hypothetical protein
MMVCAYVLPLDEARVHGVIVTDSGRGMKTYIRRCMLLPCDTVFRLPLVRICPPSHVFDAKLAWILHGSARDLGA